MKRRGTPATLPAWWQGWPARTHVRRWIDDLVLSEDRFMERAARRDAQAAAGASGRKPKRKRVHGAALHPAPMSWRRSTRQKSTQTNICPMA